MNSWNCHQKHLQNLRTTSHWPADLEWTVDSCWVAFSAGIFLYLLRYRWQFHSDYDADAHASNGLGIVFHILRRNNSWRRYYSNWFASIGFCSWLYPYPLTLTSLFVPIRDHRRCSNLRLKLSSNNQCETKFLIDCYLFLKIAQQITSIGWIFIFIQRCVETIEICNFIVRFLRVRIRRLWNTLCAFLFQRLLRGLLQKSNWTKNVRLCYSNINNLFG